MIAMKIYQTDNDHYDILSNLIYFFNIQNAHRQILFMALYLSISSLFLFIISISLIIVSFILFLRLYFRSASVQVITTLFIRSIIQ